MTYTRRTRIAALLMAVSAVVGLRGEARAAEEIKVDPAAAGVLGAAKQAYAEGRWDAAVAGFRDYLGRFGKYPDAVTARYGLGLALVLKPESDAAGAATELGAVAEKDFAGKAFSLYYLAVAERQQGAALGDKPDGGGAAGKFKAAAKHFEQAAGAFGVKSKPLTAADGEWQIQARLDAAEMLVRGGSTEAKRAAGIVAEVMKGEAFAKSRFLARAEYLAGQAEFVQANYGPAGRMLAKLAPFTDADFGLPGRYLLARCHDLMGQRPEALAQYRGVLADFEPARQRAQQRLGDQRLTREQRAYYTAMVSAPVEYVQRAALYAGIILAQTGKNGEAQEILVKLMQGNPKPTIAEEAKLWQGLCQMQAKNYSQAADLLEPLRENARFGEQARWWAARGRALAADAANAQAYGQTLAAAIEQMKKAAEQAGALAKAGDAAALVRRADILLDVGDTQMLARQFKPAAQTYELVANEFALTAPDRAEQALERAVSALHGAGDYAASDAAGAKFRAKYPKSTLLAGVAFREAENAYLPAVGTVGGGGKAGNAALLPVAAARLKQVIDTYPDFQYANAARAGLGSCLFRQGKFEEAAAVLATVPEADRIGELSSVNYLLGDCLIRGIPEQTPDALSASHLLEDGARAAKLLVLFAAANDKNPQAGEAVLKTALCHERLADVIVDPTERQKNLLAAREMLDRAINMLPKENPNLAVAVIEKAAVQAELGDAGGAINELQGFGRNEKLKGSAQWPLAALRLARLLRVTNRAGEAADYLRVLREQQEGALLADGDKGGWLPRIMGEQAVALKESGKLAEARAMLGALVGQYGSTPDGAAAAWRLTQIRREELLARLAVARRAVGGVGAKVPEAVGRELDEAIKALRQAAEDAETAANSLSVEARGGAGSEAESRLRYEAAWMLRGAAEAQIDMARRGMQGEALAKAAAKVKDRTNLRPPEVALADVPVQPDEQRMREAYQRLMARDETSAVGVRARLEYAEIVMGRGEFDASLEMLADAMAMDPADDVVERIRLRMAACWIARGDELSVKAALATAKVVLANNRSPLRGEALYCVGEAQIARKDWPAAYETLRSFRDTSAFAGVQGISDRAFYRLATVLRELGKPEDSRQVLTELVQRYAASPWAIEAQYQLGQIYQTQKNYEAAINSYSDLTRRATWTLAAKSQLQIGLIRLEQGNFRDAAAALLAVRAGYDCPELTPQAMVEAARAYVGLKEPAEARKLLSEVVQAAPKSEWAMIAEKKLTEIKQ